MFSRRTAWNLATNRYTEALEEHRRAGRQLLDLTASNPTTIGLSYREDELLHSLTQRDVLTYQPIAQGLISAREAVAAYYEEKGSRVTTEDLILTTSTSEAYSFVFRLLCDPGDVVLVPTPSYPLFDFLGDLNDVKLVPYELVYDHGWQIDFESLRQAIARATSERSRCRAVLVVHPNNPTGSYVEPHEVAELNAICSVNEMAIIADEVFLDYSLDRRVPQTFSAYTEALTFTLSGLSKISCLPQMKVAWVATSGPEILKAEALARLAVIADTYLSMNAPIQLAVPTMLAERQNIQPQIMHRVRTNLGELDAQLSGQTLCRRMAVEGGWYAVLRIPVLGPDEEFAVALLRESGVLLHPGHFFNFPGEGYMVASLITPVAEFAEGLRRTLKFIAR
ncbi:MAG TPA: pyridoxal phosphate-dependent aminotransferase [Terriglobales bacterium]